MDGSNKERPRPESFKKPVKLLVTGQLPVTSQNAVF